MAGAANARAKEGRRTDFAMDNIERVGLSERVRLLPRRTASFRGAD